MGLADCVLLKRTAQVGLTRRRWSA